MEFDENGMRITQESGDQKGKKSPFDNPFNLADPKKFGVQLAAKISAIRNGGQSGPSTIHYATVGLAYSHLYGQDVEGTGANASYVSLSGNQGNVSQMRVPQAAAMLSKVFNLVVAGEVTWSAVATTTDVASEAQTVVAKNALAYYWKDKGTEPKAKTVGFEALAFGEGALHIPWNPNLGQPVGMDKTGRIVHAGDIDYRPVSTWNIIRDPTAKSWDSMDWIVIQEYENKYDVAAQCNTIRAKNACVKNSGILYTEECKWVPFNNQDVVGETDLIPVYYLYHKDTPSVPGGRQTKFLPNGVILSDSVLDKTYLERLPVVRIAAGSMANTAFPRTPFFASLGSQQACDSMYKDILTNNQAVSKGIIWVEDLNSSANFELTSGPQVLVGKPGTKPPIVLNLQTPNTQSFELLTSLQKQMAQILGLDSLTSGETSGAGLSGVSMVTLVQTAVQNNSQLQSSWAKFLTEIGEVTLAHIKYNMPEPRKVALAGQARKSLVTSVDLSAKAIEGVDRVRVDLASAMESTESGRNELAQMALKTGWIQTPEDFQMVQDCGRLDALTQDLSNELITINEENEALAAGKPAKAIVTEDHSLHIKKHKAILNTMAAKSDPNVVDAVLAHIDEHSNLWMTTDPQKLAIYGIKPCPPPSAPQGTPPGAPPGVQGSPPMNPNHPPGPIAGPPAPMAHPMPPMPNLATQGIPQPAGLPPNPLAKANNPPGMPSAMTAAPGQIGTLPPALTRPPPKH